jgi:phospholipase/carboxylesterase
MRDPKLHESGIRLTRREAIGAGLAGIAVALIGCDSNPTGGNRVDGDPRLTVRPSAPTMGIEPGLHDFSVPLNRNVLLYVPSSYDPEVAAPLAVMLHGATGTATRGLIPFQSFADELGMILLAPESYSRTWDMILGRYGVDVHFIDTALQFVFDRCNVDPERLAIAGFSDGASYALSLGMSNGNLFRYIAAFSPGFLVRKLPQGEPDIFVSHGTQDQVLPIEECSRRIVPRLRGFGYEVDYREFDGPHGVLLEHARVAAEQIAGVPSATLG